MKFNGNTLIVILSDYWSRVQASLIPVMEQTVLSGLTENEKRRVTMMDIISVEKQVDITLHYGRGTKLCSSLGCQGVPGEMVISRSFAVLDCSAFGDKVHEALVRSRIGDSVRMHVISDSSEITVP